MAAILVLAAGLLWYGSASHPDARQARVPWDPGTADVLFSSAFGTARGNSSRAVSDGGRWNIVSRGSESTMEIVSATGLDFPTDNAYRVIATREMQGWSMLRRTGLPVPAVGDSRYYRWYMRVTMPDALDDYNTHPIQDGVAGSQTNWMFVVINSNNAALTGVPQGKWQPQFWATSAPHPYQRWFGPNLDKNRTYRFELHIHRVSAAEFRMNVRVFDSDDRAIAGDADFRNYERNPVTLATPRTFPFTNVQSMDGLNAGNNGIAGTAPFPFTYAYQGAFAVCSRAWCGPWNGTY